MTNEELKDHIAGLSVAHAELTRLLAEQAREADRRNAETTRLLAEQAQTADRRSAEADRRSAEADRRREEADRRREEADREMRELRKQIGGLGEKFGGFTEGMAFPAMKKILEEGLEMEVVAPRVTAHHNGETMELDVLAHVNGERNEVCVVEVKSRLRQRHIRHLERKLERFTRFFPEHRGKKLYGILAVVDATGEQRHKVLARGLYFARIHDDAFQLDVPADFEPRVFPL